MKEQLKEMFQDKQFQKDLMINTGLTLAYAVLVIGVMEVWKWYLGYKVAVAVGVVITPKAWLVIVAKSAVGAFFVITVSTAIKEWSRRAPQHVESK